MMMHVSARAMARPVCVCVHATQSRDRHLLARLERVSEDVRVDGVRGRGTVCARFRGGASAVCLFPFRRRAGHDPVNRAGCSASGRCSRSGTWARDYARETGMGARLHTQVSPLNRECPAGCMLLHACSCWSRWFPNLCLTESGGSTPQRPRRLPRRGAKPAANLGLQRPVGHHSVKR